MGHLVGTLRGVTVLVVEDAPYSRALIRAALEYCGATALTVDSAPAAKSVLAAIRPKVVITDLAMPGNGFDLLRHMRAEAEKHGISTPVVAATGYPDLHDGAIRAGATAFLNKPVRPSQLCRTVRETAH
jgi:CheY-like chemotaxis protein